MCFLYVNLAKAAESLWSELGMCPSFCHRPCWWEQSGQFVGYPPLGKVERGSRKKETGERVSGRGNLDAMACFYPLSSGSKALRLLPAWSVISVCARTVCRHWVFPEPSFLPLAEVPQTLDSQVERVSGSRMHTALTLACSLPPPTADVALF